MKFYSTKHQSPRVGLAQAVMQGLPTDNGLFMPEQINTLPPAFFEPTHIESLSFAELSFQVAKCLLNNTIEDEALRDIVYGAINFDAPLHYLNEQLACLELFHGPSAAFKDFGARFMARIMGHFVKNATQKLYILVATSGDTGGAVAQGFLGTPNIEVIILYPSQKISELQEKQLTTLGQNITALEVKGTFDDCQRLVKTAFLDAELRQKLQLSSANSINLARLIPQAFYYFRAYQQLKDKSKPVVMCVPSGNFGNLTAGLLAKRMGLPVQKFVAANNANNVFTEYHRTNIFNARPSVKTLSNAMDVGNPSNLQRIQDLYSHDIQQLRQDIAAYAYTDTETEATIKKVYQQNGYLICPHTAVGYLGIQDFFADHPEYENKGTTGIFFGTAHPAKFLDIVEPALSIKVAIPTNLRKLMNREKVAQLMPTNFAVFKDWLLQTWS